MTDYRVVKSFSLDDLVARVASLLQSSWEPQGGVSIVVSPVNGSYIYFQAMVRKG